MTDEKDKEETRITTYSYDDNSLDTEYIQEKIDRETEDIINNAIVASSGDELQDLTNLFTLNQKKKEMLRIHKLNSLMDVITDEVKERVENVRYAEDKDLIGYMKVVQNSIDKSTEKLNQEHQMPSIQFNQQNINLGTNSDTTQVSRESREKVLEFVKNVLNGQNQNQINPTVNISDLNIVEESEDEED